jgi:hypothetical protein
MLRFTPKSKARGEEAPRAEPSALRYVRKRDQLPQYEGAAIICGCICAGATVRTGAGV